MTSRATAVGLAAGEAGANSIEGPSLRGGDGVVNQSLPLIGAGTDHDRPGQVGTVSVHLGAEVKQEELSGLDHPLAGSGMRQRGPRPRRHDSWERMPLAPLLRRAASSSAATASSCCPCCNLPQHLVQRSLSYLRSPTDRLHFAGVLYQPELLDQVADRLPLRLLHRDDSLAIAHRGDVRLETQSRSVFRFAHHLAEPVPGADPVDLDSGGVPRLTRGLRRVAEIGNEGGAGLPNQQQRGRAGEPCEVSDVCQRQHQQPIESCRSKPRQQGALTGLSEVSHRGVATPAPAARGRSPAVRIRRQRRGRDPPAGSAAAPVRAKRCSRDALPRTAL
mgnify:CR=1 FL=1